MDSRRFLIGTCAGAVIVLASGILIFALPPCRQFLNEALNAGSATGVERDPPLFWAAALGALFYSALIAAVIIGFGRRLNAGYGLKIGAGVGFLLWFTADLMLYAITNVGNLATMLLAPLIELIPGAIAGGVIAAVLGRSEPVTASAGALTN